MHSKYVIYAGGRPSHGVAKGYGARRTFVVLRGGMFDPQGWTLVPDRHKRKNVSRLTSAVYFALA